MWRTCATQILVGLPEGVMRVKVSVFVSPAPHGHTIALCDRRESRPDQRWWDAKAARRRRLRRFPAEPGSHPHDLAS